MTRQRSIFLLLLAAGLTGVALRWPRKDLADADNIRPTPPPLRLPNSTANPLLPGFAHFAQPPPRAEALHILQDLKAQLRSLPRPESLALIRAFLAADSDRPTGLSFEISQDGSLSEWPTLRVFLLDLLPPLDPAAAISRQILGVPTLPDEWAVALRNVALADPAPETNQWLRQKTEILINHPPWQADPSIGYLNAFDVLVYIHATGSLPLLSSLIQQKARTDLAHAAFLALDGLVLRCPIEALTILSSDTALQQSRPEMTAQTLARADLRHPSQRELAKRWLLHPQRTSAELHSFANVFPNQNHFVSRNLLTTAPTASASDLAEHDPAALAILCEWQQSPEFQPISSYLHNMRSRLESFVNSPTPPHPATSDQ